MPTSWYYSFWWKTCLVKYGLRYTNGCCWKKHSPYENNRTQNMSVNSWSICIVVKFIYLFFTHANHPMYYIICLCMSVCSCNHLGLTTQPAFVLLAYTSLADSRTLLKQLLTCLDFILDSEDLFCWYKQKKWFLWTITAPQAAENHGDEWGLSWYLRWGIYSSIPT